MAQDVQSWLGADETNFGWVVLAEGEGHSPVTAKRFDSRENATSAFRPVLQIVYNPPPPDCDAGLPDAGPSDAGVEDNPGTGPRPDRFIDEIGRGGCQAAPGPALGLFGVTLLALTRLRRRRVRFAPGG
jgi:MYXO-CTERM domain-containing protein